MKQKRVCARDGCTRQFEPYHGHQKFCRHECSRLEQQDRKRRERAPAERVCARDGCTETFVPRKKDQKYHHRSCSAKAWNDGRRLPDRLLRPAGENAAARAERKPKQQHPDGWTPGVELDGARGRITTKPLDDGKPDWAEQLTSWGFDPKHYRVLEPVQIRTWEAPIGDGEVRQLWYYRANIVARYGDDQESARVDVEQLAQAIRRQPRKRAPAPAGDAAFVVALSDWQAGKRDGDGLAGLVSRVEQTIEEVEARVRALRKAGRALRDLYVLGLGDLVEGCDGHYAQQEFTVELDARDQRKIVRRLLLRALERWSQLFDRVIVAAIGGNHGENRKNGKSFTTFNDNADVEVVESVADILAANPERYGHVRFVLPRDELTLTLDVAGTTLGIAHGHQARGGGAPLDKIWRWWKDQTYGGQPVGDAAILVTGHYHYLSVREDCGRVHIQCPTLDGGSDWFRNMKGTQSKPGTLTFTIGPDGWGDLDILARAQLEEADA